MAERGAGMIGFDCRAGAGLTEDDTLRRRL